MVVQAAYAVRFGILMSMRAPTTRAVREPKIHPRRQEVIDLLIKIREDELY
ncbi:hypothetical protein Syun_004323 [Stephania yunnanensis]|uniref:Uncharacterized protein n=1 Tax=Stephania yunnanensis TaxID=152371 RepID=A0AAP0Q4U3_9MAGN